jgi:hypothetical protein
METWRRWWHSILLDRCPRFRSSYRPQRWRAFRNPNCHFLHGQYSAAKSNSFNAQSEKGTGRQQLHVESCEGRRLHR